MTAHGIISDVSTAADVLRSGGIIGMPTETVYGLAALAQNERAVHRVFDTKGRPRQHPLIIHISSLDEAMKYGKFNETAVALASAFWPGPLTLLVPRTSLVADWVTGGRDSVALRVPSHSIAQQLLKSVAEGVVAPSANRFGKVSPTSAEHVLLDLGDDVDAILDGGPCGVGVESTIVECTDTFRFFDQVMFRLIKSPTLPEGILSPLTDHRVPLACWNPITHPTPKSSLLTLSKTRNLN